MTWIKTKFFNIILCITSCIILIPLCIYFFNFHNELSDQNTFGQFGSYFGGVVSPLLTFLTIIILIITIKIQRQELEMTKIDSLKSNLFAVLKEIDKNLDQYKRPNDKSDLKKIKNNIAITVAIKQMYRFLLQVDAIDNRSPILEYYMRKYLFLADILDHINNEKNKIPEILEYFKNKLYEYDSMH